MDMKRKRKNTRIIYMQIKRRLNRNCLSLFICIHGPPLLMRFLVFFPPCPSCSVIAVTSRHMDCWQRMLHLCFAPDLKSLQRRSVRCLHSDSRQPALALHLPPSSSLWWRRGWLFFFSPACWGFNFLHLPPGDCASSVPGSYGCGAGLNLPSHCETCRLLVK